MLLHTMRHRRSRKQGISNIIVVMLSLVLIVIVVANVILWSYQMNQLDLERMHERVTVSEVKRVTASDWSAVRDEFALEVGSRINGVYTDTNAVDDQYETFMEGLDWWRTEYGYRRQMTIVNNAVSMLDVDYSLCVTMDTTSLVSAGKILLSADDLRVVYWSGTSWIELDRDVIGINDNSTQVWFKNQAAMAAYDSDSNYYIYYGNPSAGSPPANRSNVYLWFDDFNRGDNLDITTEASYDVKTGDGTWSIETEKLKNVGADGDPNKLIITALGNVSFSVDMLAKINVASLGGGDLSRMGLSCCMDTSPSRGSGYCSLFHEDRNSLDFLNDLRSWGTRGTYSWSLNTWYCMRFRVIDPASRLGKVKVWQVGTSEPGAWTLDGSFGGGAARNYGEVGFAGSRRADTTYFDDIVIRYAVDPEPSVSLAAEEGQGINSLDISGTFTVDMSTYPLAYIKSVEIQMRYRSSDIDENWYLKAYNWSSSAYSDGGFNFTGGHTPTGEWDYYAVNLTDQWISYLHVNGTVSVKVTDESADIDQTTVDIDFFAVRVVVAGTSFTFDNRESLTSHLVSLWVNNSTQHQRFDIDLFINSGDTKSYLRGDISLPEEAYMIKVVTERGNIAVFP